MTEFFGMVALLAQGALCYGVMAHAPHWTASSFAHRFFLLSFVLAVAAAFLSGWLWQNHLRLSGSLSSQLWLLLLLLWGMREVLPRVGVRVDLLTVLFMPYSLVLVGLALLSSFSVVRHDETVMTQDGWITVHMLSAIVGYGVLSWASLAALACLLRARVLAGRKHLQSFLAALPSIREAERMEHQLLIASVVLMVMAMVSGFVAFSSYQTAWMKILLFLLAFGLAVMLLLMRLYAGVAGVRAARVLLVSWFCLSLAWIGVTLVGGSE